MMSIMRRMGVMIGIGLLCLGLMPSTHADSTTFSDPNAVLIVYDSTPGRGSSAYLNGLFLANLMGHFDKTYTLLPIEQYTLGELNHYAATFYLGTSFNHALPASFIEDVLNTTQPIVWFKYNLWQLLSRDPDFYTQHGFRLDYMDNRGYDQVLYKKTVLTKNQLDPELGHVTITNPFIASAPAMAQQTKTGKIIPYVVQSGHFWYVADVPFTFIAEDDRYLVFADLLYDMLQVKTDEQKRAILRLEDIDPTYNPVLLRQVADYLFSQGVPFGVSVIPYYQDPLGVYNHGVPKLIKMTEAPEFVAVLKYMESKGGTIILHGYTHQYSNVKNAYTGVSGHDYEFFNVGVDPVTLKITSFQSLPEDTRAWVSDRVMAALSLLSQSGLSASIWETPHYAASYEDNQYFADTFPAIIGRVLYFDPENAAQAAGQFFPYVIHKDTYGQKIIPENLGCVSPVSWFSFPTRMVDDLLLTAQKNLMMRDAWASMYYHPYLGLTYLQELVSGIKALGYTFVAVTPELI